MESEPWVIGQLTLAEFVRYAGASGDFNPVHFDPAVAAKIGAPTVFGHGMLSAGLLASYLSTWVGREHIRRIRFRFNDRLWPEDVIIATGRCLSVSRSVGWLEADLEASLTAQGGTTKAVATCQVSSSDFEADIPQ